ncbi:MULTISPECIES: potassium channel family protein [Streptomyces]|uniref:Metal transporter n=1 Tax=Streptomyces spororaveus TaxID=284039 RepID=A0ABQ3TFW6_9ACTN|nr:MULTISPECIES: potassium channel family protein [Streptomyces]MCM9080778.1 potassium channel family protein [Streptomyces spororaveus]MCX5304795.1 potassium channel family protein [Streptomyces sp. NBC_00160]GHI78870.1 metal transporter [Streptomyces spororaveus]
MERNAADHPRLALLGHLLRSVLAVALLTGLYYVVPLEGGFGITTVLTLALGLVVFGLLTAWQITAIAHAPYPRMRALEALATGVPLFLVLFSATYYLLAAQDPASFSEPLSRTDALYFTITTFATVGFGDIVATTQGGRVLVTFQMVADLILIGIIAKALVGAVKIGMHRRSSQAPGRNDES